jgi:BirA family biotin operon repressor/biotin-[acetyl-CoA-carboxylase] ligase
MNNRITCNQIIKLGSVDSTNNYAAKLVRQTKTPFGSVIMADFQTNGKGQRANTWISDISKNLLFSIYEDSSFLNPSTFFYLSKITALSIREFILEESNVKAVIKWPNDVLVENKKIAGILIENQWRNNNLISSIIGIGININQVVFPYGIVASSLKKITTKDFELRPLLNNYLEIFSKWLKLLKNRDFDLINDQYHRHLFNYNSWSNYHKSGENFKAKLLGVNESGLLILQLEDGSEKLFDIKQITQLI